MIIENKSESDLALLRRINSLTVNGVQISEYFVHRGVSVWGFFQGDLWSLIRRRSGELSLNEVAASRAPIHIPAALFVLASSLAALAWVCIRRPKAVLYTPDVVLGQLRADPRVSLIYDWLNAKRISYVEFVHTIPGRRMFRNWFRRRRPVIFLASFDILHDLFVWLGLWRRRFPIVDWKAMISTDADPDPANRQFMYFMLKRYAIRAEAAAFRIDALRQLIRIIPFKVFLSLDDPRYSSELLFALREKGIPSHVFQHGRFDIYSTTHIYYDIPPALCIAPDAFWVWNEYNRKKIIRLSPVFAHHQDRVNVGGFPFHKEIPPLKKTHGKNAVILMLYEGYAPPEQIRAYITQILARGQTEIIFSVRPDFELEYQLERSGVAEFADNPHFQVVTKIARADWERIDLVAGTTSTLLEEMIGIGRPVAVLDTSTTQASDLVEDGLAEMVTLDTVERFSHIARTDSGELDRRRRMLATTVSLRDTLGTIFRQ